MSMAGDGDGDHPGGISAGPRSMISKIPRATVEAPAADMEQVIQAAARWFFLATSVSPPASSATAPHQFRQGLQRRREKGRIRRG